ncbi:hypothetical protein BOW53_09985 [Solemya pervernicosa gill symbiont]|uniref:Secreted protein n=2 Tax=Gammaproteobacteria incertae sedis TaxID=118884 RepID=A0A1T2L448_9GAMM|nr:hypothetical protein [Solemya pervernicosa gill symbiont]OOZ39844.1 hypothetical protein BOW53_09985 [Solemya pervernicosa gill symbiont]
MVRIHLATTMVALLAATFTIPASATEMSEEKRDLLIDNYIYRSVIARLSVEDRSDGMDFYRFEDMDWLCTEDRCEKKNKRIVAKNVKRLYNAVDQYRLNCEYDLEGLRGKLDTYISYDLNELEVNSVGDHRVFRTTDKLFQSINRITDGKSGEYRRTSSRLETQFNRSGKVMVTCVAVATVLSNTNSKVKEAMEQGTACQPYDRLKACLKEFAEVSQAIYRRKIEYRDERGYQLIDLQEPLRFMDWLSSKGE